MVKPQVDIDKLSKDEQFICSTYAARDLGEPIPKYEMPDESMPAQSAYRLIHDEVMLDSKPGQNLATFCTTWMEKEADELIAKGLHLNLADEDEYPHTIEIEKRCVNMLAHLYHAEPGEGVGTSTIGSSEAMMLAGLAMKWKWRQRREAKGLSADKPNLVMGENVQVCWEKFARYFDVTPKMIPIEPGRYVITPEQVKEAMDENTIGVCAILGSTFTGEYEPIKEIHDAVVEVNKENDWDVPVHIDGASGGFVAPFLSPEAGFDFRLPQVRSVNLSGHKYGLVYPGVGWVIWRNKDALPEELIFHVNYLGGDMPTFNLNFSRPASHVIAQYYNFLRLGKAGYRRIMEALKATSDFLYDSVNEIGCFEMMSNKESLPVVVFAVKPDQGFDAFELSHVLREYGWVVPAYTMPKNAESMAALRVVVREGFSRDTGDSLLNNIKQAVERLKGKANGDGQKGESHHKAC